MLDFSQTSSNIFSVVFLFIVYYISHQECNANISINQKKFARSGHLKLFFFPPLIISGSYMYIVLLFVCFFPSNEHCHTGAISKEPATALL